MDRLTEKELDFINVAIQGYVLKHFDETYRAEDPNRTFSANDYYNGVKQGYLAGASFVARNINRLIDVVYASKYMHENGE